MGALSSFVIDHGITFDLCFYLPWIWRAVSQAFISFFRLARNHDGLNRCMDIVL